MALRAMERRAPIHFHGHHDRRLLVCKPQLVTVPGTLARVDRHRDGVHADLLQRVDPAAVIRSDPGPGVPASVRVNADAADSERVLVRRREERPVRVVVAVLPSAAAVFVAAVIGSFTLNTHSFVTVVVLPMMPSRWR